MSKITLNSYVCYSEYLYCLCTILIYVHVPLTITELFIVSTGKPVTEAMTYMKKV